MFAPAPASPLAFDLSAGPERKCLTSVRTVSQRAYHEQSPSRREKETKLQRSHALHRARHARAVVSTERVSPGSSPRMPLSSRPQSPGASWLVTPQKPSGARASQSAATRRALGTRRASLVAPTRSSSRGGTHSCRPMATSCVASCGWRVVSTSIMSWMPQLPPNGSHSSGKHVPLTLSGWYHVLMPRSCHDGQPPPLPPPPPPPSGSGGVPVAWHGTLRSGV